MHSPYLFILLDYLLQLWSHGYLFYSLGYNPIFFIINSKAVHIIPAFAIGSSCALLPVDGTLQSSSEFLSIWWIGCCPIHESLGKPNKTFTVYWVEVCFLTQVNVVWPRQPSSHQVPAGWPTSSPLRHPWSWLTGTCGISQVM